MEAFTSKYQPNPNKVALPVSESEPNHQLTPPKPRQLNAPNDKRKVCLSGFCYKFHNYLNQKQKIKNQNQKSESKIKIKHKLAQTQSTPTI